MKPAASPPQRLRAWCARNPWRAWLAAAGGAAVLALGGCAQPPRTIAVEQLPQDALFAASHEAADAAAAADRLFEMSAPMREYAERVLRQPGGWRDRRQALIDALYGKDALHLAYDAEATRTAAEAFEARAGNCLSLVLMTAAFAKHLDLPVSYQQVLVDEEYTRAGGLYFASGHVNVMLGRHGGPARVDDAHWLMIDFLPQLDLRGQRTLQLEEHTLAAMFLNNRAAEALARGELDKAYWWARTALQRDGTFAAAANTLAVVYQRGGHFAAAERALRFVIEREPASANAWSNLVRLLRAQGRDAEARVAAERLAAIEPTPPFHFLELGRQALQRGEAAQARDLFQRELRVQPQQHEAHFGLAQAYAALGDARNAARHLALAAEYSPTRSARAIYAAKLDRLRATQHQ
ncbi:MAG: tetratricopeptide repeat protein [Rubrivivax sp.]|nr:tetratricopeptide repeat protein [Rubrivivax sp.]